MAEGSDMLGGGSQQYVVSTVFRATDKISPTIHSINRAAGRNTAAMARAAAAAREWSRATSERLMGAGRTATAAMTLPFSLAGGAALKAAADIEVYKTSFNTMMGDAKKGKKVFDTLVEFANVTPFQTDEVIGVGKMLLGYGVKADELKSTLNSIGDAAAGVGKPLFDIAAIYGKIISLGVIQSEEMRQFAENSINIKPAMMRLFATPDGSRQLDPENLEDQKYFQKEIVEKRVLNFKMFEKVFDALSEKGGMFFGMMEELSKLLSGRWSTLTSKIWLASAAMGEVFADITGLNKALEKAAAATDKFREGFQKWAKANPVMAEFAITLGLIAAAAGPVLVVLGSIAFIVSLLTLKFTLITLGVLGAVVVWVRFRKQAERVIKILNGVVTVVAGLTVAVGLLLLPLLGVKGVLVLIGAAAVLLYSQWGNLTDLIGEMILKVWQLKEAFRFNPPAWLEKVAGWLGGTTGAAQGNFGGGSILRDLPVQTGHPAARNSKVRLDVNIGGDGAKGARVSARSDSSDVELEIGDNWALGGAGA